ATARLVTTYHLNRLQGHADARDQYFLTLDADARVDPACVLARVEFTHPTFGAGLERAQQALRRGGGSGPEGFCGSAEGCGVRGGGGEVGVGGGRGVEGRGVNACVYRALVTHVRLEPVAHRFTYPATFFGIDVDALPELARHLPWLGHNRWRPLALHDADYL